MSKDNEPPAFYVLDEDKAWARDQIAIIQKAIQDMGPEFNVALTQSNETWHDNAPFDALRDEQSLLVADLENLQEVLFKAAIAVPKAHAGRVAIGSRVTVVHNNQLAHYFVAGHWTPLAGHMQDGALVVSCGSPIGSVLLGAKVGATIVVPTNQRELVITDIVPPAKR